MPNMLETELETYKRNKEKLLETAKGKFVLIRGKRVRGIFDTEMEASDEGHRRWGNVAFLVHEIRRRERVLVQVPRYIWK